jgi:methionyl aminopeptidase
MDLEILLKLGEETKNIRNAVKKLIKVGISDKEIIDFIETKIFELGYLPSFPAMVVFNEEAAHYTIYNEERKIEKGDLVNVDFGLSFEGWITDNAITLEVETKEHTKLLEVSEKILNTIIDKMEIGVELWELGKISDEMAKENNFNSIHNLCGHQIKQYELHAGANIPNYNNNDKTKICDNSQYAIEPFITYGDPMIKSDKNCNIIHLKNDKNIRDIIAKKLLIHIRKNFPKLPFSKRWLIDEVIQKLTNGKIKGFSKRQVDLGIESLKKEGIIYEYDLLVTTDKKLVSQFEHCVVFKDGKKYIITK